MKLVFESEKELAQALRLDLPHWLSVELKATEKGLKTEISNRGNTVHSWNVKDDRLEPFRLVSALLAMKVDHPSITLPAELLNAEKHYRESKRLLGARCSHVVSFSELMLARILADHAPRPIDLIEKAVSIIDSINSQRMAIPARSS